MRFSLQTRFNDYDSKGHVNNAVYLTYFELGRVQAWLAAGGEVDGDFILAEAKITYRSPALMGDPLDLEVTTSEIRTKAWVWRYRILDSRDDRLVAEGETVQVMFDYAARRTVPIPPAIRDGLARI
jgi:acyl-CoA thioester hydrolase